jgi:hypothetical protein
MANIFFDGNLAKMITSAPVLRDSRQLVQLAVERHPAVKVRLEQLLHTLNTHLSAIEKHEKQVGTYHSLNF